MGNTLPNGNPRLSQMSVLGSLDGLSGDGGAGRTVFAEMPVYVPPQGRRKTKQKSPQQQIDDFWGKFTTKAPGKGEPGCFSSTSFLWDREGTHLISRTHPIYLCFAQPTQSFVTKAPRKAGQCRPSANACR
jgi:hypothetical protein